MTTTVTPGAPVWVSALRVTQLDVNGYPAAGNLSYTSLATIKATAAAVKETGDEIAVKGASGDLVVFGKHGDMIKWGTITLDLAYPDPQLEAVCSGGVILNDTTSALGATTGLTATGQTTLGTLKAATYGYRASQYNAYGESVAEVEVDVTTTGSTSTVVLTGVTPASGALEIRYYGRSPGLAGLLGSQPIIGSQSTSAASGTGTVDALTMTALTKPIPIGTQFQITGDSNTPPIVFTATATAGVGALTVSVSISQSVTTTIDAGDLVPCFVDNGSLTPGQQPQSIDTTAGPGNGTGFQASALGPVGNPNGVSLEIWQKRIISGKQDATYPYWRFVYPKVANFSITTRDHANAAFQTTMEGQAEENANWGSGPFGDWQFDSTAWVQRAVSGAQILPVAGYAPVVATV